MMGAKIKDNMYFYRPQGYEERVIGGKKMYRDATMVMGVWRELPEHAIDRLLEHILVLTGCPSRTVLRDIINVPTETVSRVRKGLNIPLAWLVRMADYSGLTLTELRTIGDLEPTLPRYDQQATSVKSEAA